MAELQGQAAILKVFEIARERTRQSLERWLSEGEAQAKQALEADASDKAAASEFLKTASYLRARLNDPRARIEDLAAIAKAEHAAAKLRAELVPLANVGYRFRRGRRVGARSALGKLVFRYCAQHPGAAFDDVIAYLTTHGRPTVIEVSHAPRRGLFVDWTSGRGKRPKAQRIYADALRRMVRRAQRAAGQPA